MLVLPLMTHCRDSVAMTPKCQKSAIDLSPDLPYHLACVIEETDGMALLRSLFRG